MVYPLGLFSRKVRRSLRSVTVRALNMPSLISPLKSIVNAFLNGQLVPSSTATPSRCNSTRKSKNSTLASQGCYFWCTRWRIAETPQAEASRQSVVAYKVSSSREPWALPNPAGTKMPPQKGGVWCTRWGSSHAKLFFAFGHARRLPIGARFSRP